MTNIEAITYAANIARAFLVGSVIIALIILGGLV